MAAKRASDRAFGLVFGGLFAVVSAVVWRLSGALPIWAAAISASFVLCAILIPGLLMPLNRIWTRIGGTIAIVVNYVLLGTFFFLVLLPFGLVSRFGRDALSKRPNPDVKSYWKPVRRQASAETYSDLF